MAKLDRCIALTVVSFCPLLSQYLLNWQNANSDFSGSDSEADDVFDLPIEDVKKAQANRKPRTSVSAEAFGNWNKKEEFKAPFYEKNADTI